MMLPKIDTPTQLFTFPVNKTTISYRRFTVKEEKILLMAAASDAPEDMVQAFRQVINNCIITEDVNVDDIPTFDLELLFLMLRINSVSNVVQLRIKDTEDGEVYDLEIDLQAMVDGIIKNIKIPDKKLQLTPRVGVVMRDITLKNMNSTVTDDGNVEEIFRMLGSMIEKVYDEDNVYLVKDFSEEEIQEFIESFPPDAVTQLQTYMNELPKLVYQQSYKRKDGSEGLLRLEGIDDFFQYV